VTGAVTGNIPDMTRFQATNESAAVVAAERGAVWDALTDPVLLPRLTPLLRGIDVDEGDPTLWHWHLIRMSVLGVGVATTFTERMRFTDQQRIDYHHEPPPGAGERTGAEGIYQLRDVDGGTHLRIKLTLHVTLPLSRLAAPVVERTMATVMSRTGDRFAANLLRHLGVGEPSGTAR
jgi:carbon monoxide dehydrogenase subunit G